MNLTNYMILTLIKKDIKNADVITCKLRLVLTETTNNKLEFVKEKRRKK